MIKTKWFKIVDLFLGLLQLLHCLALWRHYMITRQRELSFLHNLQIKTIQL
jgi:hypothetical protein